MELLHRQNTWRLEAHEVARPLHVPEKEPGHGMFTALPICFIMTISLYICISLTWFCLVVFADKRHVVPRLNLVNVADLNRDLRSKVFVSEDRFLRAVHLILDFEPISDTFQEVGHAIKAGDLRLRRIDVFVPGFLARRTSRPSSCHPLLPSLKQRF